jgi:hypothetical protein
MATWIRKIIEIISGTHSVEEIHGNSQEDMVIRSPERFRQIAGHRDVSTPDP